jgi:hypothetical protein
MSELTLPLALFNLLPVVFTGVAVFFLARLVGDLDPAHREMAVLGGVLVLLGGCSKAAWKLILVTTGVDSPWLANALFPLMAPGFAILAGAVSGAFLRLRGHGETDGLRYWVGAILLLVIGTVVVRTLGLGIPRGWFLPLLVLVGIANLVLSLVLIAIALRLGRKGAAALFGLNLMMVFVLPPIAMAGPESLSMHWVEQILTALGTAAFALGAYLLSDRAANRDPPASNQSRIR